LEKNINELNELIKQCLIAKSELILCLDEYGTLMNVNFSPMTLVEKDIVFAQDSMCDRTTSR